VRRGLDLEGADATDDAIDAVVAACEGDARAALTTVEVAVALLIAVRPLSPRATALGSLLAVGMFLTTLSFLFTTPGVWEPSLGGFPALSGKPGQFLIKDLPLLGIALWSLGEACQASERTKGVALHDDKEHQS